MLGVRSPRRDGLWERRRAVNSGSSSMEPPPLDPHGKPSGRPVNRRAEIWIESRSGSRTGWGRIPDIDSLHADASAVLVVRRPAHAPARGEGSDAGTGVPAQMSRDLRRAHFCRARELNPSDFDRVIQYPRSSITKNQHAADPQEPDGAIRSRSVRPRTFAAGLNSWAASLGVLFTKDIDHSDVVLACYTISSGE